MRQPFLQLLITPMQVLLTLLTNEPPSTDAVLRCSISFSELLHIFRVCFVHLNGMSELQIGCIAPQILAFACVCVSVCLCVCVCGCVFVSFASSSDMSFCHSSRVSCIREYFRKETAPRSAVDLHLDRHAGSTC